MPKYANYYIYLTCELDYARFKDMSWQPVNDDKARLLNSDSTRANRDGKGIPFFQQGLQIAFGWSAELAHSQAVYLHRPGDDGAYRKRVIYMYIHWLIMDQHFTTDKVNKYMQALAYDFSLAGYQDMAPGESDPVQGHHAGPKIRQQDRPHPGGIRLLRRSDFPRSSLKKCLNIYLSGLTYKTTYRILLIVPTMRRQ